MQRPYDAVFFDIDGTLVSFRTHVMPPSTRAALRRLRGRGVRIVLATGRLLRDIGPVEEFDYDGYITVNGGCCLDRNRRAIFDCGVPLPTLERALDCAEREPFALSFMTEEGIFVNRTEPRVEQQARLVGLPSPPERDLRALARRLTVYQVNLYVDPGREAELMRTCFEGCVSSRWNDLFADVNPEGVDKSRAMERMAEYLGVELTRTAAFGDGGNDAGMIRRAGLGVAMGDGCAEAKAAADYVAPPVDEDGVAFALEHFGLI